MCSQICDIIWTENVFMLFYTSITYLYVCICNCGSDSREASTRQPKKYNLLSTESLSSQNLSVSGSKFEYCVLGKLAEHNPTKLVRGTKTISKKSVKRTSCRFVFEASSGGRTEDTLQQSSRAESLCLCTAESWRHGDAGCRLT